MALNLGLNYTTRITVMK